MLNETYQEKTVRVSKNAGIRVSGFCRKSSKNVQAKLKTMELEKKKKAMGVDLMNMVLGGASDEKINQTLVQNRTVMVEKKEQIDALKAQAKAIKQETRQKIIHPKTQKGKLRNDQVEVNFSARAEELELVYTDRSKHEEPAVSKMSPEVEKEEISTPYYYADDDEATQASTVAPMPPPIPSAPPATEDRSAPRKDPGIFPDILRYCEV